MTVTPTHPDLIRMQQPDAMSAGHGTCQRCRQTRPLFVHRQTATWFEEHDECPDCMGHDEEAVVTRSLCPRCWSETPETEKAET